VSGVIINVFVMNCLYFLLTHISSAIVSCSACNRYTNLLAFLLCNSHNKNKMSVHICDHLLHSVKGFVYIGVRFLS